MKIENVKVSIIMPCYNDGRYIQKSIQSVINQTIQSWELIIIDDGSDDSETLLYLNKLEHPKIKIYFEEHGGPSHARNKGIKYASGKYILPLDADDIIAPSYLEKAISVLDQDSSIGIVYCEAEFFDKKQERWNLPNFTIERMLLHNIIFVTSLFRKSDWEAIGGFDEHLEYGLEDYDFWLSILERKTTVYRIPEILFYYRIKSLSRNKKFELDEDRVKETYNYIFFKHINLYRNNFDKVIPLFRKEIIENEYKGIRLKSKIPFYEIFINNNGLKNMIKRILNI